MSIEQLRSKLSVAASNYNAQQRSKANRNAGSGFSEGMGLVYSWSEYLSRSSMWKKIADENPTLIEGMTYKFPTRPRPTDFLTNQEQIDLLKDEMKTSKWNYDQELKSVRRDHDLEIKTLQMEFRLSEMRNRKETSDLSSKLETLVHWRRKCELHFPSSVDPQS